jgi:hypothetical protein
MPEGYVYIMINPAMREMVKIGGTEREPDARADELQSTGVPFEFVLLHAERVTDWAGVERKLHEHFALHRVSPNREFFRVPARDAIRAAVAIAEPFLAPAQRAEEAPLLTETQPSASAEPEATTEPDYSGFHTVHRVDTTCNECGTAFSCTVRRYETSVRCPQCRTLCSTRVVWL